MMTVNALSRGQASRDRELCSGQSYGVLLTLLSAAGRLYRLKKNCIDK